MPFISMKLLSALLAALTLSLLGNAWQLRLSGRAQAAHEAAMTLAKKEGELAAARAAAEVSTQLASDSAQAHADLLEQLGEIAARGQRIKVVYRQAAAAAPLPANCAPGKARVDAVNEALGGVK